MAKPRTALDLLAEDEARSQRVSASAPRSDSSLSKPDEWFLRALIGSASAAGVSVSPLSAMGVPTVMACVNAVSRSMASIPLKLYRRLPNGDREEAADQMLYQLLHDAPNEEMTSVDFRRAIQANATLRQNGYARIIRNGLGEVVELVPIAIGDICAKREDTPAQTLYYEVKGSRVEARSILHIRGLTFNGISGMDSVGAAREAIGLAIALQDHGAKFFKNASTPSLGIEAPAGMTIAQVQEFGRIWDELNGSKNQHKRTILSGGMKFANLPTADHEKSQFLEAKIYQDKCIAQVFGVPQIKAGITDAAHFNNVEQENQNYITDTLMSWAAQWEQSLNQKLLAPAQRRNFFFAFVFEGLLRGDVKSRYEAYQMAIQNGIMSRNEARRRENMNTVPGGDRMIIPMNMQLLDEDGNPVPQDAGARGNERAFAA